MRARLLLLAVGPGGAAAAHLDGDGAGGGLRRLQWSPADRAVAVALRPYDVIDADLRRDDDSPFPLDSFRTTDVARAGRLSGRKVERILRPLVHPDSRPLLGGPGSSVAYWTVPTDAPSVALIDPSRDPRIERDAHLRLHCRFRWRRLEHDLLLDDPIVDERLSHPTATVLEGGTLQRALGWRPHRLVVALTPPRAGRCHKVVAGMLPRP